MSCTSSIFFDALPPISVSPSQSRGSASEGAAPPAEGNSADILDSGMAHSHSSADERNGHAHKHAGKDEFATREWDRGRARGVEERD